MATSLNTSVPARDSSYQLVHYLRRAIDCAAVTTGTVTTIGTLPASALVVSGTGVFVTTDLTGGGSSNNVDIGYATDSLGSSVGTAYASALNLTTTTGGFTAADELTTQKARPRANPTTVTATWTGSATTGVFEVVVAFVPNR